MNEITRLETVQQYNEYFGMDTLHPLVTVIEGHKAKPVRFCKKLYDIYAILIKDADCGNLKYGRSIYDYRQGTMLFIAPGQVMGSEDDGQLHQPEGWVLSFHPELLHGTPLAQSMRDYTYFSYNANEALHLSAGERQTIIGCMENIRGELQSPVFDKHSRSLIVDNVKLLLDYCIRFYDRQFTIREKMNNDIIARFEALLDDYFRSGKPATEGLPTVQYCADKLCLSSNYLSDLMKRISGESAKKHIRRKVLETAIGLVTDTARPVSEIAYRLGFQYPQHFSRWFKQQTGCTPREYRVQL